MTVVFDAEPLLAFAFDEPGAREVEGWLDRVYDTEIDGYVTTIDLAEFRYVAIRRASTRQADAHIDDLRAMGVTEYGIDGLWEPASGLKATQAPSLGDAYAVAAARELGDERATEVTLVVGPDDDYDAFEGADAGYSIERFRDTSV